MFIPYKIEEEHEYTGKPILTYTIIVICVAVHLYLYKYSTEFFRNNVFYDYGVIPVDYCWWNSLSCTFLHGGIMHLLGNMYFLWIYGRTCEKALGTIKFTLLYIIGAFVSVWAHVISISWFFADDPTIGASGAISAVLGAFLVMFPKTRVRLLVTTFGRPLPAFAPAAFVLGFLVPDADRLQFATGRSCGERRVLGSYRWLCHRRGYRRPVCLAAQLLTGQGRTQEGGNYDAVMADPSAPAATRHR